MNFVRVGYVCGLFGLDGAVKVKPVTEHPDIFFNIEYMLFAKERQPVRSLKVAGIAPKGDFLIVFLEGIKSVSEAETLKTLQIVVPEDVLPEEETGEIYWYRIEGAEVADEEGRYIGRLCDYMETGSSDVFRIKLEKGGYALISNNKDHVLNIDADNCKITINSCGLVSEDI